jgi:hypothetical protein
MIGGLAPRRGHHRERYGQIKFDDEVFQEIDKS